MKVTAIMEKAKDGHYSCYVEEDLPGFGLSGFGDTAEAAKEDMMKAYQEIKEMQEEEGKEVPELEFTYKYDMQSFFDYFSFLNVTKSCGIGWYKSVFDASIYIRSNQRRTKTV